MTKNAVGRPQNEKRLKSGSGYALANWLNTNLADLTDLTNEELAIKLGYSKPNIISMWKTARTKIPLDKIHLLSKLLNVDLMILLPLYLEQYSSADGYLEIQASLSRMVTAKEAKIIEYLREIADNHEYELVEDKKDLLASCFRKVKTKESNSEREAFYESNYNPEEDYGSLGGRNKT